MGQHRNLVIITGIGKWSRDYKCMNSKRVPDMKLESFEIEEFLLVFEDTKESEEPIKMPSKVQTSKKGLTLKTVTKDNWSFHRPNRSFLEHHPLDTLFSYSLVYSVWLVEGDELWLSKIVRVGHFALEVLQHRQRNSSMFGQGNFFLLGKFITISCL